MVGWLPAGEGISVTPARLLINYTLPVEAFSVQFWLRQACLRDLACGIVPLIVVLLSMAGDQSFRIRGHR